MAKKKENNKDNKKLILIIIAIVALIATGVFIFMTVNKEPEPEEFKIEGIDIAKNKDMLKDTKVDILDITNQVLYNQNDVSTFSAVINNNSNKDYYIKSLYVIFTINKEKKKMLVVKNTNVKANDKKAINLSFDIDMLNTTKIEYEINN